jgi:hypothetical protein
MTQSSMNKPAASLRQVSVTPSPNSHNWHCSTCYRLLGRRMNGRLHVRMTHGREYFTTLPTTAVCRCGALNELPAAPIR